MCSEQFPADESADDNRDRLDHDCSLHFDNEGKTKGQPKNELTDITMHAQYWKDVGSVYASFMKRMDEQQRSRDRAYRMIKPAAKHDNANSDRAAGQPKGRQQSGSAITKGDLRYNRTGGTVNAPITELLGRLTNQLVQLVPALSRNLNDQTPVVVHRFMTIPLEDIVDQ